MQRGGRVSRFAPSPTGYLHRGHAFSALTAQTVAQEGQGRLLLRIEDIDTARCQPQFEAAIKEDLAWLGIGFEEPTRRQSDHLADYHDALDRLRGLGVLYRCFRTRAVVMAQIGAAPHGPATSGQFTPLSADEESQRLEEGAPFAWRLSLRAAEDRLGGFHHLGFWELGTGPLGQRGWIVADPQPGGDIIVARKDLGVSYHLAVVVDDALQSVSHVVRGEDLFEAVHVQRVLQALLGLPTPAYHHHRLILRPDGKRFAKRDTGETLRDLRARGMTPAELRADLGMGG